MLVALLLAALPGAFADILPVLPINVSEQVSASGSALFCVDPLDPSTCVHDAFSFAASNATTGTYLVSRFGQAAVQSPIDSRFLTIEASAQQASVVSTSDFETQMNTGSVVFGFANHVYGSASVDNQFAVKFDLADPAKVHLIGSMAATSCGFAEGGFGSSSLAEAQLEFIGPGFDFERELSAPQCESQLSLDEQFLLNPAEYTFGAFTSVSNLSGNPFAGSLDSEADLSFEVDFTAIPEPRWISILSSVFPAVLCACTVLSRRFTREA